MKSRGLVVGIGGTTRPNSSSERLVRAVLTEVETQGFATQMFGGADLAQLPHFAPENSARTAEQTRLVEAVRDCDGLVLGTPGYHGGVSGLVKNAIDLLEDLRGDTRCYFSGRGVGVVVTAAGWQACGTTLSAMRDIVHAMRGWPTPIGIGINTVAENPFAADGAIATVAVAELIRAMATQIIEPASRPQ